MPSGVEHIKVSRVTKLFTDLITVSMPSGVEHQLNNNIIASTGAADHRLDAFGR